MQQFKFLEKIACGWIGPDCESLELGYELEVSANRGKSLIPLVYI